MSDKIKILKTEILSDKRYILKNVSFEYLRNDGTRDVQDRQVYDRGDAVTILLYNTSKKSVLLTKQFRLPTFLNGNKTGMLLECCAGMLDADNPEVAIKRETEEETGYKINDVRKVFEAYMSPGVLTELIHFFVGEYSTEMKISEGGGLKEEHEDIEVREIKFDECLLMIKNGEIKDAKTLLLIQHARIAGILRYCIIKQ